MEKTEKRIRIGVFGYSRGKAYADQVQYLDADLVACCDRVPRRLELARSSGTFTEDAGFYSDFDEFIQHDMDAVIIANYWHEHAPYAIKAMEAGKDVLSECTPAATLADCVALIRCAEKTGRKYMLGENYPHIRCIEEMRRIYQDGTLGPVAYAEGEYVHTGQHHMGNYRVSPSLSHWRKYVPATAYITHSLAPLMFITGEMPVRVNARSIYRPDFFRDTSKFNADIAAMLLIETNSGAIFRVTGHAQFAPGGNNYRICGTKGGVETVHGSDFAKVRLQYNSWNLPTPGTPRIAEYEAVWDHPELADIAKEAGHGGGDFFVMYHFLRYLREGIEPPFGVLAAVTMSATEIMAARSSRENGKCFEIPDFTKEEVRVLYENDHLCPIPDENGEASWPACSHPEYRPTEEALAAAERSVEFDP